MGDIESKDIPPGWWNGCHTNDGMRVKGFSELVYLEGEKTGIIKRDPTGKPVYTKFTPDVLKKFCGYSNRYPMYSDEYMYATNGHIAIRIPRKSYVFFFENLDDKVPEGVENIFVTTKRGATGYPLPLYNQTCWEGDNSIVEPVCIGSCLVTSAHVDLLMTYMPTVEFYPTEPEVPIFFNFDGGEGVLMPLRQPAEATS